MENARLGSTDIEYFLSLQKVLLDSTALDVFCIFLEMNLKRINLCKENV